MLDTGGPIGDGCDVFNDTFPRMDASVQGQCAARSIYAPDINYNERHLVDLDTTCKTYEVFCDASSSLLKRALTPDLGHRLW